MTPLPLLQQREIEAGVIAPLFRAFVAEVGETRAREIVGGVIRELATQAGCAASANGNDLVHLKHTVEKWTEGGVGTDRAARRPGGVRVRRDPVPVRGDVRPTGADRVGRVALVRATPP